MSPTKPKNVAASVRQKLTNLSKQRGEEFQFILSEYAIERLLYRISRSKHSERFVLKGAKLFTLWADQPHRATWDLDLLSKGDSSVEKLVQTFHEICEVSVEDDGLIFDAASIQGEAIRADEEYKGVRLKMIARLGTRADSGSGGHRVWGHYYARTYASGVSNVVEFSFSGDSDVFA